VLQAQAELKTQKVDACFLFSPVDIVYFTGLKISSGGLFIHKTKGAVFFVDGRYRESAQKLLPTYSLDSEEALHFLRTCKKMVLAFDSAVTTYDQYLSLQALKKKIPFSLKPISGVFKEQRAIKDKEELRKLRMSAALLWKGFEVIRAHLTWGISEKELALLFEQYSRKEGAEALSFEPIIAFGARSALPHARAGTARLKKGDVVLIDIGVVVDGYHSDMTRTLFFQGGNPTLKRYLKIVQEAQKAALDLCKPKARVGDLDKVARAVMRKEGVEHLFVHSLGHGVGLEIHEFPRISEKGKDKDVLLEEGMVITVEPGLYEPGLGGVRYEDTVIITRAGYRRITG